MEKIDTKKIIRFMYTESFRSKTLWYALFLMPISALSIGTAVPYIISTILAKLAQSPDTFRWQTSILQLITVGIIGVIANRIAFTLLLTSQAETLERIEIMQASSLMKKDSSFYADRMAGKIVSDSFGLISSFIQFQDLIVINVLPFLITLIMGIVIVSINSFILGFSLFVMTMTVIISAILSSKKRAPLRLLRHEALRNIRGHLADIVTNNQTVKIFAREKEELKNHKKLAKILTDRRIYEWRLVSINGNNRIIAILILQILFIIALIFRVTQNPMLLSTGIFAFAFTITLTNRLFEVSTLIRGFETALTDAAPMINILSEKPTIIDSPSADILTPHKGEVELRNVTFGYSEYSNKSVLFKNLSIHINPGEKVGLVGHSGGGKTTMTKLLLRLVDIHGGEILIDGQNITNVTQESLRKNIAFVPQEPILFHRSIKDNISYGNPNASIDEIIKISKLAYAHDFIKDLPKKYDTLVGERGVKLSGGQRQRVAIARAMLKDAPILILDEATSALDSESEVYIQKALWQLMKNRTTVVIAHRLSTIQKMDRIIVLDNGKIIEQGSHSELIAQNGTYADLWAHQSGGFIEE